VLDKYWDRYARAWAVAHAVADKECRSGHDHAWATTPARVYGRIAELQADSARAEYERALLAARDNTKNPAELFRIASKHPLAFDVWVRDLDDWGKLELLRRLMQGAPYRVSPC
jgi:hypothetical protein